MKPWLTLLLFALVCTCVRAQNLPVEYRQMVSDAWAAFQNKQPRKALQHYADAFDVHPGEAIDLLRAALIAQDLKKYDAAAGLTDYLFKKYPLEAGVTFLESQELAFAREEPLYSSMLELAARALVADDEYIYKQDPTAYRERLRFPRQAGSKETNIFETTKYHYVVKSTLYIVLVETAHHAMLAGDYQRASDYYRKAFAISQDSTRSLLRAAICAYRAKDPEAADIYVEKAFKTSLKSVTLSMIRLTPEFQPFLEYPQLRALVGKQLDQYFPELNAGLVSTIDSLTNLFFTYRQIDSIVCAEVFPIIYSDRISDAARRSLQDSLDLIISRRIDAMLSTLGYPSHKLIADRAEDFELLLSAVQPEVLEKHWEKILTACSDNPFSFKGDAKYMAQRYDVNCYLLGQKQKYGSIWFVPPSLKASGISRWPIEDPLLVNDYRAEIGLDALDNSEKSKQGFFNLEAQQQIGELQPGVRDEVHAVGYPIRHPAVQNFFRQ